MASSASVGLTSIAIRVNPSRGGEEFGEGSKMQSQKTESKEKKVQKKNFLKDFLCARGRKSCWGSRCGVGELLLGPWDGAV